MKASNARFVSLLLVGALHTSGCCKPGDVDAAPDCPTGREASATLTLIGDLDGIRPIDGDTEIEVRGQRETADLCVEEGARSVFLVRLRSDLGDTQTFDDLAPGDWTIIVTSLSGGEHREIRHEIELRAGSSSLLEVKSTPTGDMVLE